MGRFHNMNDICVAALRGVAIFLCNRFWAGILIASIFLLLTLIGVLKMQGSSLSMVFQFLPEGTMIPGPLGWAVTLAAFADIPDIIGMLPPVLPMAFPFIPWRTVARFAAGPVAGIVSGLLAAPADSAAASLIVPGAGATALLAAALGVPAPAALSILDPLATSSDRAVLGGLLGATAAAAPTWTSTDSLGDLAAKRRAIVELAIEHRPSQQSMASIVSALADGRAPATEALLRANPQQPPELARAIDINAILSLITDLPLLRDNNFNSLWEFLNGSTWINPLISLLDLPPGTDIFGMIKDLIPAAVETPENVLISVEMKGSPANFATVEGFRYIASYIDSLESVHQTCERGIEPLRPGHVIGGVPLQAVCGYTDGGDPIYTEWAPPKHLSLLSLLGIYKRGTNTYAHHAPNPAVVVPGAYYCDEPENLSWDETMPTTDDDVRELIRRLQYGQVRGTQTYTSLYDPSIDHSATTRPLLVGVAGAGKLGTDLALFPENVKFDHGYYIGSPSSSSEDGHIDYIGAVQFKIYFSTPAAGNCISINSKAGKGKIPLVYPGFPDITGVDALMTEVDMLYWCILPVVVTIIVVTCRTSHHIFWARTRMALNIWIGALIGLGIAGGYSMLGLTNRESTAINLIGAFVVVGAGLDGFFVLNSHYQEECKHITHKVRDIEALRKAMSPAARTDGVAAAAPVDTSRGAANPEIALLELGIADIDTFYCGQPPHTRVSHEEELVRVRLAELASIEAFADAGSTIAIALVTTSVSMFFMLFSAMPAMRAIGVQSGASTLFVLAYFITLYYPAWVADNRRQARGHADFSNEPYKAADLEEFFLIEGPKMKKEFETDPDKRSQSIIERCLAFLMRIETTPIGAAVVLALTLVIVGFGIWGWAGGVRVQTDESLIDYKLMPGPEYAAKLEKHFARSVSLDFLMTEVNLFDPTSRDAVRATLDRVRDRIPLYNPGGIWVPEEDSVICYLEEDVFAAEKAGNGYVSDDTLLAAFGSMACKEMEMPMAPTGNWLSQFQPLTWFGDDLSVAQTAQQYGQQWANSDNFANRIFPLVFTTLFEWIINLIVALVSGLIPSLSGAQTSASMVGPAAFAAAAATGTLSTPYGATEFLVTNLGDVMPTYLSGLDTTALGLTADDLRAMRDLATVSPPSAASVAVAALTKRQKQIVDAMFARAFSGMDPVQVVNELASLSEFIAENGADIVNATTPKTAAAATEAEEEDDLAESTSTSTMFDHAELAAADGAKDWSARGVPNPTDVFTGTTAYQINLAKIVRYFKLGTCEMLEWEDEARQGSGNTHRAYMYPMMSTCKVWMDKTVPRTIYTPLNATVAPDLIKKGRFSAFFTSYDFLLMLIDASVPGECISTAVCIVALCAIFAIFFMENWRVGIIVTGTVLLIQLSILSGWAIFGYTLSMITLAAFILSSGMSIDYVFHVSSAYLSAPYTEDKRARIIQGISSTGQAVFIGWFTSVVTMFPLIFTTLMTFVDFFYCFFLVLVVSIYFAFCTMPVLLWIFAPNEPPRADVNHELLKKKRKIRAQRRKREKERQRRIRRGLDADPQDHMESVRSEADGSTIVRRRVRVRTGGSSVGSVCPSHEGFSEMTSDGQGNRVRRRRAANALNTSFIDQMSTIERKIIRAAASARRQNAREAARERARMRITLYRASRAVAARLDTGGVADTCPGEDY